MTCTAPGPGAGRGCGGRGGWRAGRSLGESELVGVLCGWQRLAGWAQAGQAACVSELVGRRKAQSVELARPSLAGHVDDEVAAALALTGRAAGRLPVQVSAGLARLPGGPGRAGRGAGGLGEGVPVRGLPGGGCPLVMPRRSLTQWCWRLGGGAEDGGAAAGGAGAGGAGV